MLRLASLGFFVAAVAACGASATAPPAAAPTPTPPRASAPRMHLSSELGEIDEAATSRAFARARPALTHCYTAGLDRLDYLAGDVKFYLRVQANGRLRWAFFEESTLGDHETEACMLGVLTEAQWPLPEGGEAEVHQGLGFDPPAGVRPPSDWGAERVASLVAQSAGRVTSCKKHGDGTFRVTAYVGPDHGAGRVLSAGLAPPSAAAGADVDCLLGVVRALKLPSPGSYPAKVSFSM